MKKIFMFIIGLILSLGSMSQPCLPQGIQFTRQSEVDSFPIIYPNCTQIGGNVIIGNGIVTSDITNLNGLNSITAINGRLTIFYTNYLPNLTGLDALVSIGSNLAMQSNNALTSLTGFTSLTSIGGYLDIYNNNALTNFSGLTSLTNVGSDISIYYNANLNSLSGLDKIDPNTIIGLSIWENSSLSECEVQSVCQYLANPAAHVHIYGNSTGCNSQTEVESACQALAVSDNDIKDILFLYPNPVLSSVTFRLNENSGSIKSIDINNSLGRSVLSCKLNDFNYSINVESLPSGIYLAKITTSTHIFVKKFLKE